jgi:hypothetical protein
MCCTIRCAYVAHGIVGSGVATSSLPRVVIQDGRILAESAQICCSRQVDFGSMGAMWFDILYEEVEAVLC